MAGPELAAADQGADAGFGGGAAPRAGARRGYPGRRRGTGGGGSGGGGQRKALRGQRRHGQKPEARAFAARRAHQFHLHIRQFRRGKEQSARQGGGNSSRGESGEGL